MYKKTSILAFSMITLLLMASATQAATTVRVAVVIDGIKEGEPVVKCVSVPENTDAYETLKKVAVSYEWSNSGPWGHGLCSIRGVGCPKENCFCSQDMQWNFYTKTDGENDWTYNIKSYDGGDGCDEHYCAKEGDMIGLAYGPYGTKPSALDFYNVCSKVTTKVNKDYEAKLSATEADAGEKVTLIVRDAYSKGIKDVEVRIYLGADKVLTGETDRQGEYEFVLENPGRYTININAEGYDRPQRKLYLTVKANTTIQTTTSTTEAETTTTTEETTSTTEKATTTSTTSTTSTTESTTTTSTTPTTTTSLPDTGLVGLFTGLQVENTTIAFIVAVIVIATIASYYGYGRYRKKKASGEKPAE